MYKATSAITLYPFSLNFLWTLPFYLLLIAGVVIPSDGYHGLFNLKSLGFIGTALSLGLYILSHKRVELRQFKILYGFLLFLSFLGLWIFLGELRNQTPWESQLDQFKIFLITGFVLSASLYFIYAGLTTSHRIIKTVIYSNCTYSAGKIILVAGHLLGVFNLFDVLAFLGFRFMSMGIIGDFSRLQTSVDILTPFLLFFVLQSDRLSLKLPSWFKPIYYVLSWISILLSFSRFLIFVGVMSYVLYLATLKGSKLIKSFVIALCIFATCIFAIGTDNAALIFQKRFLSKETTVSDLTRVRQIEDVMNEFSRYPFFGKGLGSYAEGNVRDGDLRYSYEVQWAAFLMQFGVFGLILLFFPMGWILWQFLIPPITRLRLGFLGLFIIWLLSGFTNPFLISLTSGIVYTLFFVTGLELAPKGLRVTQELQRRDAVYK